MSKTRLTPTLTTSRSYSLAVSTTTNSEQSLGPNIQSRLEALEVAMGVRLNLAKSQGRQSLINNSSPSPMQTSPTASSSKKTFISTRLSQGIQRSASSCDVDNRSGPSKRLKPSIPNENLSPSSSSTAAAIATIKKYPPSARRPLLINTTANQTPYRKSPPMIKQRTSPMETSSPRLSRASTASTTSSSYRTPVGGISPAPTASPSRPPTANARKRSMSVFGEQFSSEILKLNLLWIDLNELDEDSRSEVILQFGSIEHFLCEQNLFFHKQQQQLKLAAKHKTMINRSHLHLSLSKKDRLELL